MNHLSTKITAGIITAAILIVAFCSYDALSGSCESAQVADVVKRTAQSAVPAAAFPASSAVSSAASAPVILTEKPDGTVVKDAAKLKSSLCSPSAILVRLDDRTILLDKNAEQRIYPASMTKIMTVLLAIEESPDLNEKVTIQKSVIDQMNSLDASMAGFVADEQVSELDLLYGALLPSGAECCASLADCLEGSEQNFAVSMNRRAAALGMKNTHFMNTSGLHNPGHTTTVKDLAVLLNCALQNSTFRRVFTTQSYTTSPTNKHAGGVSFRSTMFRCLESQKAGRATILGGKVGYTDEAGLCLASLAELDGKEYVLVTAGAKNVYRAEIKDALTVYGSLGK